MNIRLKSNPYPEEKNQRYINSKLRWQVFRQKRRLRLQCLSAQADCSWLPVVVQAAEMDRLGQAYRFHHRKEDSSVDMNLSEYWTRREPALTLDR